MTIYLLTISLTSALVTFAMSKRRGNGRNDSAVTAIVVAAITGLTMTMYAMRGN